MASYRIFETESSAKKSAAQLRTKYGSRKTFGGFFRTFKVVKGSGGWKVVEGRK